VLFLWDIHIELFTEGFRDKIFDAEILTTLRCALSHESYYNGSGVVELFTAAVAQGAPQFFHGIFMPTYLQRGFGTGYLILRSSLHLDMH
jgi:hypothetical protein